MLSKMRFEWTGVHLFKKQGHSTTVLEILFTAIKVNFYADMSSRSWFFRSYWTGGWLILTQLLFVTYRLLKFMEKIYYCYCYCFPRCGFLAFTITRHTVKNKFSHPYKSPIILVPFSFYWHGLVPPMVTPFHPCLRVVCKPHVVWNCLGKQPHSPGQLAPGHSLIFFHHFTSKCILNCSSWHREESPEAKDQQLIH